MDRRALLLGLAAVVPASAVADGIRPKLARSESVTENLFGRIVTDRYRWMEAEGPEWKAYAETQTAYSDSVLDSLTGRRALSKAIDAATSFGA